MTSNITLQKMMLIEKKKQNNRTLWIHGINEEAKDQPSNMDCCSLLVLARTVCLKEIKTKVGLKVFFLACNGPTLVSINGLFIVRTKSLCYLV